ncbi:MAG: hypothetical protein V4677_02705 [Bacteroidota bacterium]
MQKKIILVLTILATVIATYWLINYVGMRGFLFAWSLNFMLMMFVFKFTETLKAEYTSPYYKEKNWEKTGKIYEYLGINVFRKLLVLIGWEKLNKKANPVNKNQESLTHLEYRTKQSEFGHLLVFVIVLGFNIVVIFNFGLTESVWLLVLNILLNVYPILLQRYNRPRLNRAIKLHKIRTSQ